MVELAHREFGSCGPGVIILHGLLGSSRNWLSVGKSLSDCCHVRALDLRNHGDSPHVESMTFAEMAEDVLNWMDRNAIKDTHLIGHSLGGKVAMRLACDQPGRVRTLTVVDISVRAYKPRWQREFALLKAMPVAHLANRREAEEYLADDISDWAFRQFLLSNLERNPDGTGFCWRVNLGVLERNLPNFFGRVPEEGQTYGGPVLFMRGERSRFVADEDAGMIRGHFPTVRLVTVKEAGHNVHFEQPEAFVKTWQAFVEEAGR